jgi:Flp pilus assembly protein TadD
MMMKCQLRMSVSNLQTSEGETSDCVSSIRGGAMAADGETSDSRSSIRQGAMGAKDEETSSCNAGIKEQRPVVVVPVVSENNISRTATILAGSLLLFLSLGLSKVTPAFARKVASPPSTTTTASLLQEEEEAQNQGKNSPLSNLTETETSSSDVGVSQQNTTPDKEKVPDFQTDPAELVLLKFLERHPEDLKALEGLMYVRLRKGDVKAALKILEKLLELRPAHLPWQLIRAQSLDFVGDLDEARQSFQAILEKNPLSARALQGLAIVMSKTGEEKESLEMLKKAVDAALKAERPKEAINVRMLLAQMHTMQVGIVCPEFF